MKKKLFFITGILAFLILAPVSTTWCQKLSGNVIAIEKGNIVKVFHEGKILGITLYGIHCLDPLTPYGQKALQFISRSALNQSVIIEVQKHQSDTHYTGTVTLPDGTILNQNLVKKGLATWDRQNAPGDIKLQSLESFAKNINAGLWANAVSPDTDSTSNITIAAKAASKQEKATIPSEKTRRISPLPILAITVGILMVLLAALIVLALHYKKNFAKKTPRKYLRQPPSGNQTQRPWDNPIKKCPALISIRWEKPLNQINLPFRVY
jgi:endonuclease YncB( thermonuclease family)